MSDLPVHINGPAGLVICKTDRCQLYPYIVAIMQACCALSAPIELKATACRICQLYAYVIAAMQACCALSALVELKATAWRICRCTFTDRPAWRRS